ncbi:MAG: LacI family DNA-binding transcriptional regulator [Actinomycetales bacterium]
MRDVAHASGVSPATVSFVLNDAPDQTISVETRARVIAAAGELGYRPHPIARALREGGSRLVVLEVGALPRAPMLESFIDGLDEELAAAGYGFLVSFAGSGRTSGSGAIEAVNPRAVIDLPGLYARPDGRAAGGRAADGNAADGGWVDGMASHLQAQLAHLYETGHRNVAIATPVDATSFELLLADDSRVAAERLGMPAPVVLRVGDDSLAAAIRALPESVTAIAAQTDTLAFAVVGALLDDDIAIPDRMAVIGLGDVPEAAYWRPPLTSVRVDTRSYGRRLARQLLGLAVDDAAPAPTRIVRRATA